MKSLFLKNVVYSEHKIEKKEYVKNNTSLIVIKNFLSEKDFDTCVSIIRYHLKDGEDCDTSISVSPSTLLTYGHSSVGWHPNYIPHWNFTLTSNDFFREYIFSKIKSLYEWTKEFEVKRIYCSCQTSDQFGNWHYDDHRENAYTFVLYCNISREMINNKCSGLDKKSNDAYIRRFDKLIDARYAKAEDFNDEDNHENGYFHIKYDKEPIRVIITKNNSAVLFNSTIPHLGDCHTYDSSTLRCVIAYKLALPARK